jgi:hypothetical protein
MLTDLVLRPLAILIWQARYQPALQCLGRVDIEALVSEELLPETRPFLSVAAASYLLVMLLYLA